MTRWLIGTLTIKHFKSIKRLVLTCKRINIFIGEPNTGKSNLLEALGLISHLYYGNTPSRELSHYVRMEDFTNLFYDHDLTKPIEISMGDRVFKIMQNGNQFQVLCGEKTLSYYDMTGSQNVQHIDRELSAFKFFRFSGETRLTDKGYNDRLLPPYGSNMVGILVANTELRNLIGAIFTRFGLKLVVRRKEEKIEVEKEQVGVALSYPYSTVSETFRRLAFYVAAIKTAKDSVVGLEEPEAHAFPFYARYLGEMIALDKSNQYFISTHNPYFLIAVVEKALKQSTAINLVYYEDYQTKVRSLKQDDVIELGHDVFFDLDKFLKSVEGVPSTLR